MSDIILKDSCILDFLQGGGALDSTRGAILINDLIAEAVKDHEVAGALMELDVERLSLSIMFVNTVNALLPNPTVNEGGNCVLVPSLFFMKPEKLIELLRTSWLPTAGEPVKTRVLALSEAAVQEAKAIKEFNESNYGTTGVSLARAVSGPRASTPDEQRAALLSLLRYALYGVVILAAAYILTTT